MHNVHRNAFYRSVRHDLCMPLAGLLVAGCSSHPSIEVPECANGPSVTCAAARDRFQVLQYVDLRRERLVAASSRALGDLNFDVVKRDDAAGRVIGRFIANAPTHADRLDSRFHDSLKDLAGVPLLARVEISPDTAAGAPVTVRLQLLTQPPTTDKAASSEVPVDRLAPYQLYFQQLSYELGAPKVVNTDGDANKGQKDKRKNRPDAIDTPSIPSKL